MKKTRTTMTMTGAALMAVPLLFGGCATRGYVRDTVREQIAALEGEVQKNQAGLKGLEGDVQRNRTSADLASSKADDLAGRLESIHQLALDRTGYTVVDRSSVYFDFDSADLNVKALETLRALRADLEAKPQAMVGLFGFADPTGPVNYNLDLGRRRAESVLRYLAEDSSLPLGRFETISYGENIPASEAGRVKSEAERRQVVVLVMQKNDPERHEDKLPTVSRYQ